MDTTSSKAVGMSRRAFVGTSTAALAGALLGLKPAYADETTCDVAVVGAGVIGCCTARELTRYGLDVVVLEAGLDIAPGTSRANSGIVHAGFDPAPGTLKARYNVRGAELFPTWQADLGFAYFKNGALVLAFSDEEVQTLRDLQQRGMQNGAAETFLLDQDALRALEPNVSPEAVAALHAPASGICDPYGLTYGAAENAAANGAEFRFASRVQSIARDGGGLGAAGDLGAVGGPNGPGCSDRPGGSGSYMLGVSDGTVVRARAVVNAAGLFSDQINNMVSNRELTVEPRRGEYHLYKNTVHPFNATMFQAPTAQGKGVLVSPVVFGNLIVGPNAEPQASKTDVATTAAGLADVLEKGARTWPDLPAVDEVISNFAGLRASSPEGDFVVGEAPDAPGFFNAACIDSPGLASAPAIAQDLAAQVAEYLGAAENPAFDPVRVPPVLTAMLDDAARAALAAENPLFGREVCACSHVTEGEIVEALHRALPVLSLDALKWRTGCFMGPCQGGRCTARILGIACRELGIAPGQVRKRTEGSELVVEADGAAEAGDQGETGTSGAGGADADMPGCFPDPATAPLPTTYALPRAAYRIPGTRPAGVHSPTSVCELLDAGCLPGTSAVVWGDTPEALDCADRLEAAGVATVRLGGAARILEVQGDGRVAAIRVAEDGDDEGAGSGNDGTGAAQERTPGRTVACDLLVVARDVVEAQDE